MGNGSSNSFPVHILGHSFEEHEEQKLIQCTETLFRLTYRRNMPVLCNSTLTSDSGWGCMLRAAQMMMSNTLLRHYLGRDWRIPADVAPSRVRKSRLQALAENAIYCELVRWFSDYEEYPHLYSLHHLVHLGVARYDKPAGTWVGPSTAAYMLRDLARLHCALYGGSMEVLVTQGDTIYISEANNVCTRTAEARQRFVAKQLAEYQTALTAGTAANQAAAESQPDWQEGKRARARAEPAVPVHPLLRQALRAACRENSAAEGADGDGDGADGVVVDGRLSVLSRTSSASGDGDATVPAQDAQAAGGDGDGGYLCECRGTDVARPGAPRAEPAAGTPGKNSDRREEPPSSFFDPLLRPPPSEAAPWSTALLVLVPLRLGINSVNAEYHQEIKEALRHRNCVGMLGGRPNHAIYFVGHRGDSLLGLDPHTVFPNAPQGPASSGGGQTLQPFVAPTYKPVPPPQSAGLARSAAKASADAAPRCAGATAINRAPAPRRSHPGPASSDSPTESFFSAALSTLSAYTGDSSASSAAAATFPSAEYLAQVHVCDLVPLDISRLDPSVALGFYFPTQHEFEVFCEETRVAAVAKQREGRTPLYAVQPRAPSYMYSAEDNSDAEGEEEEGGAEEAAGGTRHRRDTHSSGDKFQSSCSFDPADAEESTQGPRRSSWSRAPSRRRRSSGSVGRASESSEDSDYVLV